MYTNVKNFIYHLFLLLASLSSISSKIRIILVIKIWSGLKALWRMWRYVCYLFCWKCLVLFTHIFFWAKLDFCTGFAWQGFCSGGATGEASVRSCEKLPLPLRKTMPVDPKTDPWLAKAKTISDSSSPSVITYLRRGENLCKRNSSWKKKWEYVRETAMQTPRSMKKEGEEALHVP